MPNVNRLNAIWTGRGGEVLSGLIFVLAITGFGLLGFLAAPAMVTPQERSFNVVARQYAYTPEVIRVNRGDTVRLTFAAMDATHGFYLEGYDLDVTIPAMRTEVELRRPSDPGWVEQVEEVVFTADRGGKFRFRCSTTCGYMHPFMLGELIVEPNRLRPTSFGLALGMLIGGCLAVLVKGRRA